MNWNVSGILLSRMRPDRGSLKRARAVDGIVSDLEPKVSKL